MLIEMHGGMLTLATICTLAIVITKFHQRMRRKSGWYGAFSMLDGFFEKLAKYAEPTAYLASIGGFIGLVVSSVVGYYAWPAEVLMSSPLALKKIVLAVFSTEFWAIFIAIRSKYGESLWEDGGLTVVYACTCFVGFFFMALTGSLGAHMAGVHTPSKGSVLDPIYDLLGISPDAPWIDGPGMVPFLTVAISILVVILYLLYFRFR